MARTRLYVGNIPFTTTDQDLRDFFSPYELNDIVMVTDRETGRSRGFCFVDLVDGNVMDQAIAQCNGRELGGRTVTVNQATDKLKGSGGGGRPPRDRDRDRPRRRDRYE